MNEPLLLGLLAGITIFLGLPILALNKLKEKQMILTIFACGILIFLLVEIVAHAFEEIEEEIENALEKKISVIPALTTISLFLISLTVMMLAFALFEETFFKAQKTDEQKAFIQALLIAISIGVHNLSEGLLIGNSYSQGATRFALFLAIGFAIHNATEGFAIFTPLKITLKNMKKLLALGAIGGLPTLFGAWLGTMFHSVSALIVFSGIASGGLVYVIWQILAHIKEGNKIHTTTMLAAGFVFTALTELFLEISEHL